MVEPSASSLALRAAGIVRERLVAAGIRSGDRVLVAFSGGPDSTALLLLLAAASRELDFQVRAAHLDHGADGGSAARAQAAARLARRLGTPLFAERVELARLRRPSESPEEAARRVRYAFLERTRRELGARWILTAHHRDDQAETVLLRLLQGSGWQGLAGIAPQRGRLLRPLLGLPREALVAVVRSRGVEPVLDPTNSDPAQARSRVRHALLPRLLREDPLAPARLARVAEAARAARKTLDRRLAGLLDVRSGRAGSASIDRERLLALPDALRPAALALLHRLAGAPHPPSAASRGELLRALRARGETVRDAGAGWRWTTAAGRLRTERARPGNRVPPFAYTLPVPGELLIPELGAVLILRRGEPNDPASAGVIQRDTLSLPAEPGTVLVRNRRPGDRVLLSGSRTRTRLKEVLIDRRIPRHQRDTLPLLVCEGEVAWVPGVLVASGFETAAGERAWTAELSFIDAAEVNLS